MPSPPRRLSELASDQRDRLLQAVRAGAPRDTAAAYADLDPLRLARWLRIGRRARRGPCRELLRDVQRAEAEAELADLSLIAAQARGQTVTRSRQVTRPDGRIEQLTESVTKPDWRAAAWRLERRLPDRYAGKPQPRARRATAARPVVLGFNVPADTVPPSTKDASDTPPAVQPNADPPKPKPKPKPKPSPKP